MNPRIRSIGHIIIATILFINSQAFSQSQQVLHKDLDRLAQEVESKVIAWRRDIHQHPELSFREFRTAKIVAEHLTKLGMEIKTGIAKTGVVGILRGTFDEPVVAFRADMDALPITEKTDLSFASTVRDTWEGQEVGVMHACGHDNHTAILMGVAEVLSKVRNKFPGTVKFIFQPAEETLGGGQGMIDEGVLENPAIDAIFALHVLNQPTGTISYRSGYFQSTGKLLSIDVIGRGGHGGRQWQGVNPVIVASQIVLGLQTIISSQIDIYGDPSVVSVCMIHGGDTPTIIPEKVSIKGTIRFHKPEVGQDLSQRVERTATQIAKSAGARAEVSLSPGPPPLINDPELTRRMTPTFLRVAGESLVRNDFPRSPGGDDFSAYTQHIPGLYFFLGISPKGQNTPGLHSPEFFTDESALIVGVRAPHFCFIYETLWRAKIFF